MKRIFDIKLKRVCLSQSPAQFTDDLTAFGELRLQQFVGIEVEGRACFGLQQQVEVDRALGGAQVAPGVDEVDVFAALEFVLFDDADGALVGPGLDVQFGQRGHQARAVGADGFLAAAGALALLELAGEAGLACAGGLFQAEHGGAQLVGLGQALQGVGGFALAGEEAVEFLGLAGVDTPAEGGIKLISHDQPRAVVAGPVFHQLPGAELAGLAQAAVVHGLAFLDQARFQQQGAELAGGFDPVDAADVVGDAQFAVFALAGGKVRQHAAPQVDAFAHVEQGVVFAVKEVDAGRLGHVVQRVRWQLGRQAGAFQLLGDGIDQVLGVELAAQDLPELPDEVGVGQRAVAVVGDEAVARDEAVEVVLGVLGEERTRQAHGAQHVGLEPRPQSFEFLAHEAVVEARVVGHEQSSFQPGFQLVGHGLEAGGVRHHVVADAGHALDELGDAALRVDQGAPAADLVALDLDDADFGDAVVLRVGAGGFQVDEGDAGWEH